MGREYQIRLKDPAVAIIDKGLRECPYFDDYDKRYDMYHFRWGGSVAPEMPSAFAAIDQDGLYICLNKGRTASKEFVEHIRALVVDTLGQPFDLNEL